MNCTNKGAVMGSFDDSFCYHEQAIEQTVELPVIWDAKVLMWRHGKDIICQLQRMKYYYEVKYMKNNVVMGALSTTAFLI